MLALQNTISGFSRAMYSNWLWHRPLQLLIDAGEGLQLALGQRVWAPDIVAITHGHADHLLGLPGFIASRRFSKGAQDKPLTILYPEGSAAVETIHDLAGRLWPHEQFPVTWIGMKAGDEHRCGRTLVLQSFASRHGMSELTLGYRVLDLRRHLRAEFAGLPESDVRERVRTMGREAVMEEYRHVVFAHTGDSMPIPADLVAKADLLVHDATFLDGDDRKWDIHATVGEALAVGRAAGVGCLLLYHLSIRYERNEAVRRLRALVAESGFSGDCWLLDDGRLISLR
ncbi:MAG: MBL fold metallo-hydrolase [Acidobacteria bacterium]|nr:MBL fold metallo-hydrolase [Acidobacteriota bacterium]